MKISGFIKCHRTADHLFTLRTFVDKYVQHTPRGKLYSCFVDFKKTFDSIWHKGLLHKLYKAGTGGKFLSLVKHMHSKTAV